MQRTRSRLILLATISTMTIAGASLPVTMDLSRPIVRISKAYADRNSNSGPGNSDAGPGAGGASSSSAAGGQASVGGAGTATSGAH